MRSAGCSPVLPCPSSGIARSRSSPRSALSGLVVVYARGMMPLPGAALAGLITALGWQFWGPRLGTASVQPLRRGVPRIRLGAQPRRRTPDRVEARRPGRHGRSRRDDALLLSLHRLRRRALGLPAEGTRPPTPPFHGPGPRTPRRVAPGPLQAGRSRRVPDEFPTSSSGPSRSTSTERFSFAAKSIFPWLSRSWRSCSLARYASGANPTRGAFVR